MIAAYHLVWTVYGSWLPNDPRGSMSREIRNAEISGLGELHYGRRRIQPASGDIRQFYNAARIVLKDPVLHFSNDQIEVVSSAFSTVIREKTYTCYACAIMRDHVHMLLRKHRDKAEQMIGNFQAASRNLLIDHHARPADHPVWGGPGWKVYLETRDDIERTIRYIEDNPLKARRQRQQWAFVTKYDGWLPGVSERRR